MAASQGVSSAPISCDLWASPDDLVELVPQLDDWSARATLAEASWAIGTLLGGRFHGDVCWTELIDFAPGECEVRLGHGPVVTIYDVRLVERCGTNHWPVESWCRRDARNVSICCDPLSGRVSPAWSAIGWWAGDWWGAGHPPTCGRGRQCDDVALRVEYRTASNIPPGGSRVALAYAAEIAKAGLGQPCALPDRVQSVTRQGVTWAVLDPGTHLRDGLTGVSRVDTWIMTARRGLGGVIVDPMLGSHLSCETWCCEPTSPPPSNGDCNVFTVANEAEMLAIDTEVIGSLAIRLDTAQIYVLTALPASDLGSWTLLNPTAPTAGVNYVHQQPVPSADWTVNHNLGFSPNVTIISDAGDELEGDIDYTDLNTLHLVFLSPVAGTAYLS